ncbi:MAG: SGNH/GDSL hydrolase family protein [Thermodesulfobacteriota bacterium]|nr:SGNH/GDSL hydrolase family protein [Thermodesulfobacteriota bacterium]
MRAVGLLLISIGIFANQWILAFLFSHDGVIDAWKRLTIALFDVTCITLGCLFILFRNKIKWPEVALLFGTSFVCLMVLEIGLHLSQPKMDFKVFRHNPNGTGSYRLIPHLDYRFEYKIWDKKGHFIINTNSHGMRWRPVALEGLPNRKRIACVGDSFTFGESADKVENSFVGVFDRLIDNRAYEVLNFGVDGYGFDDIELQIREDILPFRPNYIILASFNGNDFRDTYLGLNKFDVSTGVAVWNMDVVNSKIPEEYRGGRFFGGRVGGSGQRRESPGVMGFIEERQITKYLKRLSKVFYSDMNEKDNVHKAAHNFEDFQVSNFFTSFTFWCQKAYNPLMSEAREKSLRVLERIRLLCQKNKVALLLVSVPFEEQIYCRQLTGTDRNGVEYDLRLPQKILEEFCLRQEVPYLDLMPILRSYVSEADKAIYPDTFREGGDIHFNNHGHYIVGKAIHNFFEEHLN